MSIDPVTAAYPAPDYVVAEPDRPFGEPDRVVAAPDHVVAEPDRVVAAPGEAVTDPGGGVFDPDYGVLEPGAGRPRRVAVPVTHALELRLQEVAALSRAARAPLGGPAARSRRRLGWGRRRGEAPAVRAEAERVA